MKQTPDVPANLVTERDRAESAVELHQEREAQLRGWLGRMRAFATHKGHCAVLNFPSGRNCDCGIDALIADINAPSPAGTPETTRTND